MPARTPETDTLTPREREVLALATRGMTNEAIADELGISRNAVRYHLKELHSKLGTGSDRGRLRRLRGLLPFGLAIPFGARFAAVAPIAGMGIAASGMAVAAIVTFSGGGGGTGPAAGVEPVDGRYPNGCPTAYSATRGLETLREFNLAFRIALDELLARNPGIGPDERLPHGTSVNVPYNPDATCGEAIATPAATLPPAHTSIGETRPADRARVSQAETLSPNPANPREGGICFDASFTGLDGDPQWSYRNLQWFRMFVDNVEVTNRMMWAVRSEDGVPIDGTGCYMPDEPLALGVHTAVAGVSNPANPNEPVREVVEWTFEVTP